MIRNILRGFFILLLLPLPLFAAAETWTLDPQHTYVLWKIEHLQFSTQAGKFYASGTLTIDPEKPQNSKVNATIQVEQIVTGIPELNKHLLGQLFFNATKFPTATFVSHKVTLINKKSAKIDGTLTLHGVSKPVTLKVTLNKIGKNPINDKMTMGFTAATQIKRSDFGMNTLLPDLGDDVKIEINAEASQTPPTASEKK